MQVRIVAFASAAEALGREELSLELAEGATTEELRRQLVASHPALEALWERLALAIDGRLILETTTLPAGCEVALLPPVSGGLSAPFVGLTEEPLDGQEIIRRLSRPTCGAVLLFFGNVRNHHEGRSVRALTYRAYETMALARLERIARELEAAGDQLQVAIIHRVGRVAIGEPSVVIGVASPHREAAYEASRTALERLKREVPIWKFEEYEDGGSRWREEEDLRLGDVGELGVGVRETQGTEDQG